MESIYTYTAPGTSGSTMQKQKSHQTLAILSRYVPAAFPLPCQSITGGAKHMKAGAVRWDGERRDWRVECLQQGTRKELHITWNGDSPISDSNMSIGGLMVWVPNPRVSEDRPCVSHAAACGKGPRTRL